VTAALAGFAVTFAITGATLAAVIAADTWWQSRHVDYRHHEPPSRLDVLDGASPPARSSAPSPPGKSERAGADVDGWMP
jgi:hypothetical protein